MASVGADKSKPKFRAKVERNLWWQMAFGVG